MLLAVVDLTETTPKATNNFYAKFVSSTTCTTMMTLAILLLLRMSDALLRKNCHAPEPQL